MAVSPSAVHLEIKPVVVILPLGVPGNHVRTIIRIVGVGGIFNKIPHLGHRYAAISPEGVIDVKVNLVLVDYRGVLGEGIKGNLTRYVSCQLFCPVTEMTVTAAPSLGDIDILPHDIVVGGQAQHPEHRVNPLPRPLDGEKVS